MTEGFPRTRGIDPKTDAELGALAGVPPHTRDRPFPRGLPVAAARVPPHTRDRPMPITWHRIRRWGSPAHAG